MPPESCSASHDHEKELIHASREITTAVTGSSKNIRPNGYSGVVLSSPAEIRRLGNFARPLMQTEDPMLAPEFFLASVSKGWRPKVVAVFSDRDLVGILYAKERVIAGVPTGVVYADGSLGGLLLSNPLHHQNAFRVAVEVLFATPGIRGVRLRVLQSTRDYDAILQLSTSKSFDVWYFPIEEGASLYWKHHAHLALPPSYGQFLEILGGSTRHNFRRYRQRFDASGHSFVEHLSIDELRSATLRLLPKSKFTTRPQYRYCLQENLNRVAASARPLAVGLRHKDGQWLSVTGGWYMPGGAIACFQCNNEEDFGHDSLSVVLRAYLIDMLIRQGLKELVMWADTAPPLSRYVSYLPTIGARLDIRARSWRVARSIISTVGPHLPKRLAAAAQWIS